jgi:mono/diheme cytochrome c family protein
MDKERLVSQRTLIWVLMLILVIAACSPSARQGEPTAAQDKGAESFGTTEEPAMGPGSGMMSRHHATVPEPYAGMTNPVTVNQDSLDRGAELYSTMCASCHGDGGMGDGPAGVSLDPPPAPVAHTSQMLGDDLLFWRISEGGATAPFNSALPAWKDSLDEQARWELVSYMRALGRGQVAPRPSAGGAAFDPAAEQAARAEMLRTGVEQAVITEAEAELFDEVHAAMDERTATGEFPQVGSMDQMRTALLEELVRQGTVTQEQADAFEDIHQRLIEAGLME